MNTLIKGNAFERIVYNDLKIKLIKNKLFIPATGSFIHMHKEYYSNDRQGYIETDVSIEAFIPYSSEYSLLTIVECKNLCCSVVVDDVEEFYCKVIQISGLNVKAILATTSGLQQSALAFARSKRIAIIQYVQPSHTVWLSLFYILPLLNSVVLMYIVCACIKSEYITKSDEELV